MAALTILIIGSGGREHALAWKLSQSALIEKIFVCPGNGGTAQESNTVNVDLSPSDFLALVDFAVKNEVDDHFIHCCYPNTHLNVSRSTL